MVHPRMRFYLKILLSFAFSLGMTQALATFVFSPRSIQPDWVKINKTGIVVKQFIPAVIGSVTNLVPRFSPTITIAPTPSFAKFDFVADGAPAFFTPPVLTPTPIPVPTSLPTPTPIPPTPTPIPSLTTAPVTPAPTSALIPTGIVTSTPTPTPIKTPTPRPTAILTTAPAPTTSSLPICFSARYSANTAADCNNVCKPSVCKPCRAENVPGVTFYGCFSASPISPTQAPAVGYGSAPNKPYYTSAGSACANTSKLIAAYANNQSSASCYSSVKKAIESSLTGVELFGKTIQVHSKAAAAFRAVHSALNGNRTSGSVYKFSKGSYTFSSIGTYAFRCNVNASSNTANVCNTAACVLSTHSFGISVDINPATNCNGCTSFDIPSEVVRAFENNGFRWGGRYKEVFGSTNDPMHFEYLADVCK